MAFRQNERTLWKNHNVRESMKNPRLSVQKSERSLASGLSHQIILVVTSTRHDVFSLGEQWHDNNIIIDSLNGNLIAPNPSALRLHTFEYHCVIARKKMKRKKIQNQFATTFIYTIHMEIVSVVILDLVVLNCISTIAQFRFKKVIDFRYTLCSWTRKIILYWQ